MQSKFRFASNWSDAVYAERNSIVFENKNKAYGAFVIRTTYERSLIVALLLAGLLFAGILFLPSLFTTTVPMIKIMPKAKPDATVLNKDKIVIKKDVVIVPSGRIQPPPPGRSLNFIASRKPDLDSMMEDKLPINPGTNSNKKDTASTETFHPVFSHEKAIDKPVVDPDKVLFGAEVNPEFPGGDPKLYQYLNSEMHYPEFERDNRVEGTVYLSFVINRDGAVDEIKVLRSVDNFLDAEAVRVLKKMPKWKPGKQNGNPVRVQMSIPVKFEIRKN